MKMTKLNISPQLILLFNGVERVESIRGLLPAPSEPIEVERDKHLFDNITSIMLGQYDEIDAKKNNVSEGFKLIYDICAKGGL